MQVRINFQEVRRSPQAAFLWELEIKEWQGKSIKVLLRWGFVHLWKYIPALYYCSHHSERSLKSLLVLIFWGHALRSHKHINYSEGLACTLADGYAFNNLTDRISISTVRQYLCNTLRKFRYFIKLGSKWEIWGSQVMHKFLSLACQGF